ncbi:microtubule-associated protein futsch-like [Amphibalanus amphitrite]|uniref:microtubule-associated protein futsch-like n=1 Tax=Amphibalanus amphitrite TaxID=1232801 RepID=UPI001C901CC1|nr:microtubule-associated protein futsch-like [Amphibalanus amphitrite]
MTRYGDRVISPGAETEYRAQYRRSDATESLASMARGGSRAQSAKSQQGTESLPGELQQESRPQSAEAHQEQESKQESRPQSGGLQQESRPQSGGPQQESRPQSEGPKEESISQSEGPQQESTAMSEVLQGGSNAQSQELQNETRPQSGEPQRESRPLSEEPLQQDTTQPEESQKGGSPLPDTVQQESRPQSGVTQQESRPQSGVPQHESRPQSGAPQHESRPQSGVTQQEDKPQSEEPKQGSRPQSGAAQQGYTSLSDEHENPNASIAGELQENADNAMNESLITLSNIEGQSSVHSAGAVRTSYDLMKKHEFESMAKSPLHEVDDSVQRSASQMSAKSPTEDAAVMGAELTSTHDQHGQGDELVTSELNGSRPASSTSEAKEPETEPAAAVEESHQADEDESQLGPNPVASSPHGDETSLQGNGPAEKQEQSQSEVDGLSPRPLDASSGHQNIESSEVDHASVNQDSESTHEEFSSMQPEVSSLKLDISSPLPNDSSLQPDTPSLQQDASSTQDAPSPPPDDASSPQPGTLSPQPADAVESAHADHLVTSDDEYDPLALTQSVILPVGLSGGRQSVQSEKASSPFPEVANERFSPSPTGGKDQIEKATEPNMLDVEPGTQNRSATFDLSQGENILPNSSLERQEESRADEDLNKGSVDQVDGAAVPDENEPAVSENVEDDQQTSNLNQTPNAEEARVSDNAETNSVIPEASTSTDSKDVDAGPSLTAVAASKLNVISPTPTQNNSSPDSQTKASDDDQSSHLAVPAVGAIGSLVGGSAGALGALTRRPESLENESEVSQSSALPVIEQSEGNLEADGDRADAEGQETESWLSRAKKEIKGVFTGDEEQEPNRDDDPSGTNGNATEAEEEQESGSWFSKAKDEVKGVLFGDEVKNEGDPIDGSKPQIGDNEHQESDAGNQNGRSEPQTEEQSGSLLDKARAEIKDIFTVGKDGQEQDESSKDDGKSLSGQTYEAEHLEDSTQERENSESLFSKAKNEVKGVLFGDEVDDKEDESGSESHDAPSGSQHDSSRPQEDGAALEQQSNGEEKHEEDSGQSGSWFSRARNELNSTFQDLKKDVKDTFTFPG